jgi:5-methylcytosine-specific restriction endonuclease McrA
MGTPHTMPRKPWHHTTESNTARGYGSQWRKLRASVMRRDKGLCQLCLASHRVTPASECNDIDKLHELQRAADGQGIGDQAGKGKWPIE